MRLNWVCRMGKIMLLLILSLGACSEEKEGELCFVGDSLVAGGDVKDAFPTWIVRNDGVSGAKLEEIATWNLNYQDKNVVMLIGTNNLGGKLFNDATRQEFITDFVDEYKRTIEGLAPRRVFVISILPRNREIDNPHINDYIKELNFALSQMVETLNYGVFLDVYDDFAYEDKMNMNYSLDGLHLNDLGYNILNVRLSKEL